ncbi:hypothetical protein D9756_009951 [Leucocoprinus leucothites]|uniref:Uncharacterized protein n=1 Tax=Leucocoprinus leucothites TaxID=201217 RepID=A0A8H5FSP2_9AGAR|nr:hypothetical protein D9756_009951 [Leucoagaricus leucothites]
MSTPDDLTATVHSALTALDPARKAEFLLDTALSLIDAGRYGDDVERYLDVYLKTPNLPKTKVAKALLARANARKAFGDRLLAQAHEDFHAVLRLDPSNRAVANSIRRRTQIRFAHDPPSHRAPLEVWSRIASYIPRYHLRTWLCLSTFHRSIALDHIFHTIDLYFGEDQSENVNRSMDIFERAKNDKDFSRRVKVLRVHWAYEEGELLDLMLRVFKTALPEFCALREFEWIGYPELRQDMVQFLLSVNPKLSSLGSIGFHFDACGISAFRSLKKLTLRAEDDDGYADWSEITTVLNNNASTLKHLTLGAYLLRQHSWDATFSSPTIHNLTHLDLVDTRISHTVLSRIAHAAGGVNSRLESLTLHGVLEEPGKAAVVFGSDEVIGGEHTFLPRLKAFRFLLVGQPQVITPPPPNTQPAPSPSSAPPQGPGPYYHPYSSPAAPPPPHHPAPPPSHPHPQPQPHPQDHYDPTILQLYSTIIHFLRGRTQLRKLDLGNCPWDLVAPILPGLKGLRTVGVRIGCLSLGCGATQGLVGGGGGMDLGGCMSELDVLVKNLPREVGALRVEVGVSELPLHVYANQFQKFTSLSFLHLQLHNAQPAFHPPTLPSTASSSPNPMGYHQPGSGYHHSYYQQPRQSQPPAPPQPPQQPSYHPFPPYSHPHSQHMTSTSTSSANVGGLGTPKRRSGPKRDGGEHDGDADESAIAGPSNTDGASAGPSSAPHHHAHSNAQQQPQPPLLTPQHTGHSGMGPPRLPLPGPPHQQYPPGYPFPPHPQQQHAPFPHHQQQFVQPPVPPPQPLGTLESAKYVADAVKSLDFVGWNGELYVIVRNGAQQSQQPQVAGSSTTAGVISVVENGDRASVVVDGGDVGPRMSPAVGTASSEMGGSTTPAPSTPALLPVSQQRQRQQPTPPPTASSSSTSAAPSSSASSTSTQPLIPTSQTPQPPLPPPTPPHVIVAPKSTLELKELPSRRRLDCGKGVDLGGEDAVWLERKDVPMDYDMPVTVDVNGAATAAGPGGGVEAS